MLNNGYKNLLQEFEQYSRSVDAAGKPLRPEIHAVEKIDNSKFYNFEFKYDLPGTELTGTDSIFSGATSATFWLLQKKTSLSISASAT